MKALDLKGSPEERGYFHGKQMRRETHAARFNNDRRELEAHVDDLIRHFLNIPLDSQPDSSPLPRTAVL